MKQYFSSSDQTRTARVTVIGVILLAFCGLTALAAKKSRKNSKQRRCAAY